MGFGTWRMRTLNSLAPAATELFTELCREGPGRGLWFNDLGHKGLWFNDLGLRGLWSKTKDSGSIIWPIPRLSLPKSYHEFLKRFPWVNFVVLLAKFLACARFRLFAHTKRDIAVAGHMRCGFFSAKGDRLSHCAGKVFPRRTKIFRRSCKPKRILRLGSNRRPMGIFSDPW